MLETGIPTATVADLNDDYIAKMEDVLEVYERPYDPLQPVICVDEKPVTLHADVRPASPAVPGREARRDNEYERCGTANVNIHRRKALSDVFARKRPQKSGIASPSITHPLTEAGLIRRRSKSGSSRGSVWAVDESPISRLCARRRKPGIGA